MKENYFEGKKFKGIDFTEKGFIKGEYEDCIFINCNLSAVDLSGVNFGECEFIECDLSMVKLTDTLMRGISFKDCKLIGLHFEDCKDFLFDVQFDSCHLNLSSFYQRKLKNTKFVNCVLREVDFSEVDLTEAIFINCDLKQSVFDRSILVKADFRSSYNYSIDPEINQVQKAKFSKEGLAGLLTKYNIVVE